MKLAKLAVIAFWFVLMLVCYNPGSYVYAYDNSGMNDYGGWSVGPALYADGRYVYCVEPGAITPLSPTTEPQNVDELRGYSVRSVDSTGWSGPVVVTKLSGDALREMNYVLTNFGQSADSRTRVAAQLALWTIRLSPNQHPWLSHHVNWVGTHGGGWEIGRAEEMVQQARVESLASTLEKPGELMLHENQGDQDSPWSGKVKFPVGTHSLKIEGAKFEGGSSAVSTDPSVAGELNWVAVPDASVWSAEQTVTLQGLGTGNCKIWPATIQVFPPGQMFEQSQAAGVGPVANSAEVDFPLATVHRELSFEPELHTQVKERELKPRRGTFVDKVSLTPKFPHSWPSRLLDNGEQEFLPIVVEGKLYGPFATQQPLAATAPEEAAIAATGRFLADQGEGEYEYTADSIPSLPGYYYWQWSIEGESQKEEVRESGIIPEGYRFSDDFGVSNEEYVVATEFDVTTELAENIVTRAAMTYEDMVIVKARVGEWPMNEAGERIPVVLRQLVYQEDEQPNRSKDVSPKARLIHQHKLTTRGELYPLSTGNVSLPHQTSGWITLQTCVLKEDQPETIQSQVVEGCDDYGIAEESARIEEPPLAHTGAVSERSAILIAFIGGGSILLGCGALVLRKRFKRFQH